MLFWLSILFFACLGVVDLFLFRRHISLSAVRNHKLTYYSQCLLELWVPAVILLVLILTGTVDFSATGLRWFKLANAAAPLWLSITILALSILAIAYLILDILRYRTNPAYRNLVNSKIQQAEQPAFVEHMQPKTRTEKRLFLAVSLSAGVLEEVLYRGFLITTLSSGSLALNIWIAVIIAAVLFGMGHLYQGLSGMLKTSIIGLIMGIIFAATGSIITCIILHIIIDVSFSFYDVESGKTAAPSTARPEETASQPGN
jgi:membrane protease YdiL (CAAX protease family)